MKDQKKLHLSARQKALLLLLSAILILPLVVVAQVVWQKHQYLEKSLEDIAPRYARLLGLSENREALGQSLLQVQQRKAQVLYPYEGDAAQLGNNIQTRLRNALVKAGMTVVSSEVKVEAPSDGATSEEIHVHMAVDGKLSEVQLGLIALDEIKPSIWLEDLQVISRGNVLNAVVKTEPVLSARMRFVIPRIKEEL